MSEEQKAIVNKRKGGAEKARDKNKKLLLASAKQCLTLNELFKPQKQSLNKKVCKIKCIYYAV